MVFVVYFCLLVLKARLFWYMEYQTLESPWWKDVCEGDLQFLWSGRFFDIVVFLEVAAFASIIYVCVPVIWIVRRNSWQVKVLSCKIFWWKSFFWKQCWGSCVCIQWLSHKKLFGRSKSVTIEEEKNKFEKIQRIFELNYFQEVVICPVRQMGHYVTVILPDDLWKDGSLQKDD